MDKLMIVIPAYNEEETIESVVRQWHPIVEKFGREDSKLVVLNDGSRDNTKNILTKLTEKYPKLDVVNRENSGHGATVLYGYYYALANGAEYIFQTDSDGQTRPEEFERFWNRRESYDMVIGWRRGREDGLSRVFVTKVLKLVIRICFGVTVKDANTPFRLLKAETLKEHIGDIPKDFNLSNVLLSVIYAKRDCKVNYIPIKFRPRQGGVNSINLPKIFKIGKQAVKDFIEINKVI